MAHVDVLLQCKDLISCQSVVFNSGVNGVLWGG